MTAPAPDLAARLKLMLDTNILVAAEPFDGRLEPAIEQAARLLRLANEQGHLLCVAAATREDMLEGRDPVRRRQRLAELDKFHELDEVPLDPAFVVSAGASKIGSNDHRDLRILATLNAGAASYLVSDDIRLRRRARRVGLGDAVLSLADAVVLLEGFVARALVEPPRVTRPKSYTLDGRQSIFDGLRGDYDGFDAWLAKVKRESDDRVCFVIDDSGTYAAIALLKVEAHCAYPLEQPVVKVSTFKVAPTHAGSKFGELQSISTAEKFSTGLTFVAPESSACTADHCDVRGSRPASGRKPRAGSDRWCRQTRSNTGLSARSKAVLCPARTLVSS